MRQRRGAGGGAAGRSASTLIPATVWATRASTSCTAGFESPPLRSPKLYYSNPVRRGRREVWCVIRRVRRARADPVVQANLAVSRVCLPMQTWTETPLSSRPHPDYHPAAVCWRSACGPKASIVRHVRLYRWAMPCVASSGCAARSGCSDIPGRGLPHQDSNLGASTRSSGDIIAIRHGPGAVRGGEEGRGGRGGSPGRWRCRARAACRVRRRSRRPRPQ
jgi:hypothetical protein